MSELLKNPFRIYSLAEPSLIASTEIKQGGKKEGHETLTEKGNRRLALSLYLVTKNLYEEISIFILFKETLPEEGYKLDLLLD